MQLKTERDPPLPPKLKEMLVSYPQILQHLQDALIDAATTRSSASPLEVALWALEDIMGHYVSVAAAERKAAEDHGDLVQLEAAIAKHRLMSHAGSPGTGLSDMKEFIAYFDDLQSRQK